MPVPDVSCVAPLPEPSMAVVGAYELRGGVLLTTSAADRLLQAAYSVSQAAFLNWMQARPVVRWHHEPSQRSWMTHLIWGRAHGEPACFKSLSDNRRAGDPRAGSQAAGGARFTSVWASLATAATMDSGRTIAGGVNLRWSRCGSALSKTKASNIWDTPVALVAAGDGALL